MKEEKNRKRGEEKRKKRKDRIRKKKGTKEEIVKRNHY